MDPGYTDGIRNRITKEIQIADRKRILIIDDEADLTESLKFAIENSGNYDVFIENNSVDGLAAVQRYRPDIVFLDINMPEITGPEIAEQIRENHNLSGIPIVFLSSVVMREETGGNEQVTGGEIFLAKPSDIDEIIACIERHTQK